MLYYVIVNIKYVLKLIDIIIIITFCSQDVSLLNTRLMLFQKGQDI